MYKFFTTTLILQGNGLLMDIRNCYTSLYGHILYRCLFKPRLIVLENIEHVYKNSRTPHEKKKLAIAIFSHIARTVKETFLLHCAPKILKHTLEVRGLEHFIKANDAQKGVVILCGHMGSWELRLLNCYKKEKKLWENGLFIIRRRQSTFVQKFLENIYLNFGPKIIDSIGAMKKSCHLLEKRASIIVAFDQHVSSGKSHAIEVDFFGKQTHSKRLALLVRESGAIVVPTTQYRVGSSHHIVEFFVPIPWIDAPSTQQAIYENTRQYNKVLEEFILQRPEQWWGWVYRHWY
jgi:KDO2-lipid IV(A) lauroyltransferase